MNIKDVSMSWESTRSAPNLYILSTWERKLERAMTLRAEFNFLASLTAISVGADFETIIGIPALTDFKTVSELIFLLSGLFYSLN